MASPKAQTDSSWIQTFTKKKFYPFDPDPKLICIEDIAHALSNECRFAGHTKEFYSVAQHSVLMSRSFFVSGWLGRLYALLHDASEAYLGDVPRPLKLRPEYAFYREVEANLQTAIYLKFGLDPDCPKSLKTADNEMLFVEAASELLMSPVHKEWNTPKPSNSLTITECWSPKKAEREYLKEFNKVWAKCR